MTDRQIIELFLQRDEFGIEEMGRVYGARLLNIARGLLSSEDAEECVNDTYLALWTHIPPDEPVHLFAYAVTILRNLSKDRWRALNAEKRKAEIVELSEELSECLPDPGNNTEDEAIFRATDALNRYLSRQDRTKRNIFILYYWYGKSTKEISKQFGRTKGSTEKLLARMREELKRFLKEGSDNE